MKIGVDVACLANGRGYGRFTRELLTQMVKQAPDHEFVFFADSRVTLDCALRAANVRTVVVRQNVSPTVAAAADGARSISDMLRLTRAVLHERLDVFFSPSVYTYFPLPPRLRAVVTLHDAIADRFPELTLPSRRARVFWTMKTRLALWQATLVLTVSDYSAAELEAVYNVPARRIRVAVEAPSAEYSPSDPSDVVLAARRMGLPEGARWFVYVGGFNPHKHVDSVVRAHADVAADCANPPWLLLVGTRDDDVFHGAGERIAQAIESCGTERLIRWTGFVPDSELRHVLSGAIALLLPSQSEGFGLPAVEAAACATPVIATRESPLPQLLQGGGYFVAPADEVAMARGMRALMSDEPHRQAMGTRARERSSELSWERAAGAALSALLEAAA